MQDSQAEQTNNPMTTDDEMMHLEQLSEQVDEPTTTDDPMALIEQQLEQAKQDLAKIEQAKQDLIDAELARLEEEKAKKRESAKKTCDMFKSMHHNVKGMRITQQVGKKVNIVIQSLEHLEEILSQ